MAEEIRIITSLIVMLGGCPAKTASFEVALVCKCLGDDKRLVNYPFSPTERRDKVRASVGGHDQTTN